MLLIFAESSNQIGTIILILENYNLFITRNLPIDALNLDIYFCGILNFSDDYDCYVFQFFLNMSNEFK